ncbi:5-methylcytosine-specific restriction endonuclease system specificity protein McrC [uncultured Veillonella sp.]|uniref:5-methylcytosine-specific restriction endonuclease system specificity protein McrC n=1 Tax=uncultured Veillonella sp. TaxID=159268 RepID=UPI0025E23EE2|nr:5-methylcytosine-specific restriction endonuclease system specificity protein McrC [uncultured Veillonella sp.]
MIPIQNIYYMLSYAFQVLDPQGYKQVSVEEFDNVSDMLASILSKGVSVQIKRGVGRGYLERTEPLCSPRGRFELAESIKTNSLYKKNLVCSYDAFSENIYMNRIIKSTMELLLRSDISKSRKKELRRLLVFFSEVETLDINNINWNMHYNRNNRAYEMLVSICYMIIKGLLQSTSAGSKRMMEFLDEQQMHHLYEKFIFEYYRKHFPQISVSSSEIKWAIDDGELYMLPIMKTDIMLTYHDKVLIIDAKYYSRNTQVRFDRHKIHSHNLYQIFTYVKNQSYHLKSTSFDVSGMLLYAQTDDEIQPNNTYMMSGNKISVKTLDLNCDFSEISSQLNSIVRDYFGIII